MAPSESVPALKIISLDDLLPQLLTLVTETAGVEVAADQSLMEVWILLC